MGLVVHLVVLRLALVFLPDAFRGAQIIATLVAMTSNFLLNNELTYRDRRLKGVGDAARLCAVLPDLFGGRAGQCRSGLLALFRAPGLVGGGRGRRDHGRLVELRHVHLVRLARAVIAARNAGLVIAALICPARA